MGFCDSTFRREPTCPVTASTKLAYVANSSTTGPAASSTTEPPAQIFTELLTSHAVPMLR